jgi:hypothetical protein
MPKAKCSSGAQLDLCLNLQHAGTMKGQSAHAFFGTEMKEPISPYKASVWQQLTPRERLRRSWALRSRLPDLRAVHDRKLFPKP